MVFSFYDLDKFKVMLDSVIDWDLLNDGLVWLLVGVVDVESGNFYYFDIVKECIDVCYIMVLGVLLLGLLLVEIDGWLWWDGGFVLNILLEYVFDC